MKKCLAVSLMHAGLALAGSLALAGMASAQSCTPKVSASALIKPGTLVMSTNPTLPPMQFVDSTGVLKGMRITLGDEIARRLCLKPEYIRIEFSAMIPGLQAGHGAQPCGERAGALVQLAEAQRGACTDEGHIVAPVGRGALQQRQQVGVSRGVDVGRGAGRVGAQPGSGRQGRVHGPSFHRFGQMGHCPAAGRRALDPAEAALAWLPGWDGMIRPLKPPRKTSPPAQTAPACSAPARGRSRGW